MKLQLVFGILFVTACSCMVQTQKMFGTLVSDTMAKTRDTTYLQDLILLFSLQIDEYNTDSESEYALPDLQEKYVLFLNLANKYESRSALVMLDELVQVFPFLVKK